MIKDMLKNYLKKHDKFRWKLITKKKKNKLYYAALHCQQRIWNEGLETIYPEEKVYAGPFAGMKFSKEGTWGNIWPKIIGCYEDELSGIFESLKEDAYDTIVDVGGAEGYYACGMAYVTKKAHIYTYDIAENARKAIKENAARNNLSERVEVREACTDEELARFDFGKRGFVLSDCEGFEEHLFTDKCIDNLKNVDVLVEVHDLKENYHAEGSIYEKLCKLFEKTHEIKVFTSLTAEEKVNQIQSDALKKLTYEHRYYAVDEGHDRIIDWLYLKAK